eukprot:SAG11_NODE_19414_length_467_cov_0.779891_1_plen_97_part_00
MPGPAGVADADVNRIYMLIWISPRYRPMCPYTNLRKIKTGACFSTKSTTTMIYTTPPFKKDASSGRLTRACTSTSTRCVEAPYGRYESGIVMIVQT